MQRRTLLTTALSALAAMTALAAPALAQDNWPSKTIRFVVPYPPGGPTDLMARLLQGELTKRLGVAVVVEATHTCMTIRGVRKPGSMCVTSAMKGVFRSNVSSRAEVLSLIFGHRAG